MSLRQRRAVMEEHNAGGEGLPSLLLYLKMHHQISSGTPAPLKVPFLSGQKLY